MVHYETSINIKRPDDQVFRYMTQADNTHQWADEVVAARKHTTGPVGLGTVMSENVKLGPVRSEITWEIMAFEPNRLCRYEGDTSLGRLQVTFLYGPTEGGTLLTSEVRMQLKGIYRYARPVVQYLHRRNRKRFLATIKRILEDGPD